MLIDNRLSNPFQPSLKLPIISFLGLTIALIKLQNYSDNPEKDEK